MSPPPDEAAAALMKQAYEQLADERFAEAAETFSAALAIGPQDAAARRGRGLAYLQLKRWALAAADFAVARDLEPDTADHWVELAISLAMDHQVYPAIEVFETWLAKQPACARGHLELGLLYLRIGAIPKARQQLQQALACRPTLEQRRQIESVLREQNTLDRKRLYRPDFEALHQQEQSLAQRMGAWFKSLCR